MIDNSDPDRKFESKLQKISQFLSNFLNIKNFLEIRIKNIFCSSFTYFILIFFIMIINFKIGSLSRLNLAILLLIQICIENIFFSQHSFFKLIINKDLIQKLFFTIRVLFLLIYLILSMIKKSDSTNQKIKPIFLDANRIFRTPVSKRKYESKKSVFKNINEMRGNNSNSRVFEKSVRKSRSKRREGGDRKNIDTSIKKRIISALKSVVKKI